MNRPLFLDTNAILQFFSGPSPKLRQTLEETNLIRIPFISYAELQIGFAEKSQRSKKQELKMSQLLALPNVSVHMMTLRTATEYARIFNQLKKQGTPIPVNDIWIAAEVFESNGVLYSNDGHFENIPLLDWVDGRSNQ